MPRVNDGGIRKYHELRPDTFHQGLVGTPGKIRPADPFGKEGITGNDFPLFFQIQAASTRCMSRGVKDLHLVSAEPDCHPLLQKLVGRG